MPLIKLNKNNFFHNLDIIADKTKIKTKIALVLKDNAYGHGLMEIATMAKEYGITKAVVRTNEEALKIESYFEYILVLADIPKESSQKICYAINDAKSIREFPKGTKVELKVDTLMHRNGVMFSELELALEGIKKQSLNLEAVFTHQRSADELTSEYFVQNENFKKVKAKLKNLGFTNLRFHSSNSASLFRCDEFTQDMARIGIAAYGCLESEVYDVKAFKPVLSITASKISQRILTKGERVGYGGTYTLENDAKVSNYDFGYADGFMRINSNNYITPQGFELVGLISMGNSSFLSEVNEMLVFDDAKKMAKNAKTLAYEVLTSLKPNIKRIIV